MKAPKPSPLDRLRAACRGFVAGWREPGTVHRVNVRQLKAALDARPTNDTIFNLGA